MSYYVWKLWSGSYLTNHGNPVDHRDEAMRFGSRERAIDHFGRTRAESGRPVLVRESSTPKPAPTPPGEMTVTLKQSRWILVNAISNAAFILEPDEQRPDLGYLRYLRLTSNNEKDAILTLIGEEK